MAITTGQLAVAGTKPIFTMPPSGGNIVLATTSGTIFVGPGSAVSTTSGMVVTTTPFHVATFAGSASETMFATTGSTASTVSVCWLISSGA